MLPSSGSGSWGSNPCPAVPAPRAGSRPQRSTEAGGWFRSNSDQCLERDRETTQRRRVSLLLNIAAVVLTASLLTFAAPHRSEARADASTRGGSVLAPTPNASGAAHAQRVDQPLGHTTPIRSPHRDRGGTPSWTRDVATWYGPGFYGNTTACGHRYTQHLRGVAVPSSGPRWLECGTRVTICRRGRCVRVRVIDTGAFRGHQFDLSARTAMDLCSCTRPYTMTIRWRRTK